ncbi:MAG: c-type cytochrome [Planctomycetia bacterium]|nr:c-type cytochrome [Planctomycetia bacterium]
MPATEQTWRDLKLMHLVFGFSSLAILAATVWMLGTDHNREWRQTQNKFQRLENWTVGAQIEEDDTQKFEAERQRLDLQLYQKQLAPVSQGLVDWFRSQVLYDRYLSTLAGKSGAAPDKFQKEMQNLRALSVDELAEPKYQGKISELLKQLQSEVGEETQIGPAYEQLKKLDRPKTTPDSQPVASNSSTPTEGKPADGNATDEKPTSEKPAAEKPAATTNTAAPEAAATSAGATTSTTAIDAPLREKVAAARTELFDKMRAAIARVKFIEDNTARQRKFRRADLDAVKSQLDVGVRDGASQQKLDEIQAHVDVIMIDVNKLTAKYEQATAEREALEKVLKKLAGSEDVARKNLTDFQAKLVKLRTTLTEQTSGWDIFWQNTLEMPIVDAFSPRLRIDTLWLPQLTLNNNFKDVARYDRCITCHQAIDKTAAGSATAPAYPAQERDERPIVLATPAEKPLADAIDRLLQKVYGLQLAAADAKSPTGVAIEEPTITRVWPETPAARAGLLAGDVVLLSSGSTTRKNADGKTVTITQRDALIYLLIDDAELGRPLKLTVRREKEKDPKSIALATPSIRPVRPKANADPADLLTQDAYGLRLAAQGLLKPDDVTVEVTWPDSAAARADLMRGDIITAVQYGTQNVKIYDRSMVLRYLIDQVKWGEPLKLTVRRGMPHPFASHPRLDLFMGSLSPHKMQTLGCTICHQGQGSATSFKWASHTPNSLKQEAEWDKEYNFAHNHHWIYPMYPARFNQSACLKCHHDVVELQPSPRFPDPPAKKVVDGHKLIGQLGCYGCHEIIGYDGPKRVGPDMRNEPMYYAAAAALHQDLDKHLAAAAGVDVDAAQPTAKTLAPDLQEMSALAEKVAQHPEDAPARLRLLELVNYDAARTTAPDKLLSDPGLTIEMMVLAQDVKEHSADQAVRDKLVKLLETDQQSSAPQLKKDSYDLIPLLKSPAQLSLDAQRLADQLKTVEAPGTMRKVGPSLRHVRSKLGEGTLNRWIYNPRSIRDNTKMPRFFGLVDGLTEHARQTAGLFEPVEARAIAQYLIDHSQPFEYLPTPAGVTEAPSIERGKLLFQTRGCLACHKHADVAKSNATFAPDLTGLSKKLRTEAGQQWLVSWLRDPKRYHLRTAMPNTFLDPVAVVNATGKPERAESGASKMTDPAADIAAYLLGPDFKPVTDPFTTLTDAEPPADALMPDEGPNLKPEALDALAMKHLLMDLPDQKNVPEQKNAEDKEKLARQYLEQGIPADVAAKLPGHAAELTAPISIEKKKKYVRLITLDEQVFKYLFESLKDQEQVTDKEKKASEYLLNGVPAADAAKLPGHAVELTAPLDTKKKERYIRLMSLDALALEYLLSAYPEARAKEYLAHGIPADVAPTIKGAEIEMVGPMSQKKKLDYVGRRAISKFGCSGCHDVPDFESARPIGTGLADWGRKETSKLAFEHILEFLPKEQAQMVAAAAKVQAETNGSKGEPAVASHGASMHGEAAAEEHEELNPDLPVWGPDNGYFLESLMAEQREGFLWQKLRQPRSYDYKKTENKKYSEWLRMPQFNLTDDQREQVMTFVLGLVSEPPAGQYVYRADDRHAALIQGEKVLAKFNCAGCHVLETGEWKVAFPPGSIDAPAPALLPPIVQPYFTPDEVLKSRQIDRRGLQLGSIHGMQKVNAKGYPDETVYSPGAEDFIPIEEAQGQSLDTATRGYGIELWQNTLLGGTVFKVKDPLPVFATQLMPKNPLIVKPYETRGGDFARLLLPVSIETENKVQKVGEGADAWAWGPPPLVGQGRKTQPEWLQDFLLNPTRIRPGVILRMPKFNMSSDDAAALVNYFAARDNADYPHQYGADRDRAQRLAAADRAYRKHLEAADVKNENGQKGEEPGRDVRLADAQKILLSKSGCITCHMVGDFDPQGSDRAHGPNLANVYKRLQPDYVRRWITKPDMILPYTKMPVNFPYHPDDPSQDGYWEQVPGTKQRMQPYHGDSVQQVDAVTDLLTNWDRYMESQLSIRKQVDAAGGAAPAQPANNK